MSDRATFRALGREAVQGAQPLDLRQHPKPIAAGPALVGELRFNDVDNSSRFVRLHGERIRFIALWAKWLVWEDHSWHLDDGGVRVTELAKGVSRDLYLQAAQEHDSDRAGKIASWAKASANANHINSMLKLARGIDGVSIKHTDLDTDPWLLGVLNGIVNLRTGELQVGDPDSLMMMQADTTYVPGAEAPIWEQCMIDWFPDAETRRFVHRLAGSALVGKQKQHLFVLHYGDGGNGKGTFVRALSHVLGDYFITPDKSLLVHQKHEKHDTERAALFRKRLAVAVETDHRQKLNEAQVKNLTGGDRIRARRLYENSWEFDPSHSVWLQTNYLPEIQGRDAGIWRRIRVVPWVSSFEGDAKDDELDEKLRAEAPGILNWLIQGCLEWQRNGLEEPAEVLSATSRYRDSEDVLGRFATDHGITFTEGERMLYKDLSAALTAWCEEEGIKYPPNRNSVADWLTSNGATRLGQRQIDGKRGIWWEGVANGKPAHSTEVPPVQHGSSNLSYESVEQEVAEPRGIRGTHSSEDAENPSATTESNDSRTQPPRCRPGCLCPILANGLRTCQKPDPM